MKTQRTITVSAYLAFRSTISHPISLPYLLLTCVVISGQATIVSGQSYNDFIALAEEKADSQNYIEALSAYEEAFDIHMGIGGDLYNAASYSSLIGNKDKAFDFLHAAINQGWIDSAQLSQDKDLERLKRDKRWDGVLTSISGKMKDIAGNPLTKELEEIRDKDQANRIFPPGTKFTDSLIRNMKRKDSLNQVRVKEIINKYGWLGPSEVGTKASSALFLVIQHAELEDQKQYIGFLREAVNEGHANAADLALMEDRIAIRSGEKQIYGSQIGFDKEDEKYYLFPVIAPEKIDERRRSVGLAPISEYLGAVNMEWDLEDYLKNSGTYEKYHKKYLSQRNRIF